MRSWFETDINMANEIQSLTIFGKTADLPNTENTSNDTHELFHSAEITGVLLRSDGHFMCVLEGEESVLESTLQQNIKNYNNLTILQKANIKKRSYHQWKVHISTEKDNNLIVEDELLLPTLQDKFDNQMTYLSSYEKVKQMVTYYYSRYVINSYSLNCCCETNDYRHTH